jgi:hypothetical protein
MTPDVEQLSMVHECSKTTPSIFLHKQLDVTQKLPEPGPLFTPMVK